jgi:hypothetical protein
MLAVIHAHESSTPRGRDRLDWKLNTKPPARSRKEAVERLAWYALRWKTETFYKTLKSGCRAEAARLRTVRRIVNLFAVFCILNGQISSTTTTKRVAPSASPSIALTRVETRLRDELLRSVPRRKDQQITLSQNLTRIVPLGGYLARSKDPPPGDVFMWRWPPLSG